MHAFGLRNFWEFSAVLLIWCKAFLWPGCIGIWGIPGSPIPLPKEVSLQYYIMRSPLEFTVVLEYFSVPVRLFKGGSNPQEIPMMRRLPFPMAISTAFETLGRPEMKPESEM